MRRLHTLERQGNLRKITVDIWMASNKNAMRSSFSPVADSSVHPKLPPPFCLVPSEDAQSSNRDNPLKPRLSAPLTPEYHAVCNDLAEAQELASVYQRQLAVKSNDLAQLRIVLEKVQHDVKALQATTNQLRAERQVFAFKRKPGSLF